MYTIVVDEAERERRENAINAVKRHCRIGKVSPKPPKHWGTSALKPRKQPVIPWTPGMAAPWSGGYVPVTSSGDLPFAHEVTRC